jgi:hypothetical protein
MIASAAFITTLIFLVLGILLLGECRFLIPYRHVIFMKYGSAIASFAAALFLNLFAAVYLLCRSLFLKDTGQKLAHLEKQIRTGGSISEELHRRLRDS